MVTLSLAVGCVVLVGFKELEVRESDSPEKKTLHFSFLGSFGSAANPTKVEKRLHVDGGLDLAFESYQETDDRWSWSFMSRASD